ncbi:class I SAM-dependent methyltransferase [Pseudonocardia sp. MH-G8]|uniref:class I SAM-dependent methyltransferase n=1 Tax=Pseudonocardia sp. MH-G8 TaxID=1854588 RepID=UPI000BA15F30|nr:class I SAM-dependent methyltransferase [Pseudonocardia sp. MH-G8]OZM79216.1 SAM-dependent methyltransferase [Pseudonocardia sp. MH-G8]
MSTIDTPATPTDQQVKARHRAMWASGDYPAVARELVPELGPALVTACGVRPGQRVLDVGAGTGNAALAAAAAGATVVASDLTPELLEVGRKRAADAGLELEWREGDAEALPFRTGEFDVVLSCIGAMFAPHHQPVADELTRVCRPGGTIGMLNWTPTGFVGRLLKTMSPFAPPPPPGAQPPPLWGSAEHVRELFGHRVTDLDLRTAMVAFDHCGDPLEFREYWKRNYGPTIATYRHNGADPERTAALDAAFLQFLTDSDVAGPGERARWEAEYLLVTAERSA